MAKQMDWTHPGTGAPHPGSVWVLMGVYIDHTQFTVNLDFLGYSSIEAANARRACIGSHRITVGGQDKVQDYIDLVTKLTPAEPTPTLWVVAEAAYAVAMATLDTQDGMKPNPDTGTDVPDEVPNMVSFFHNATDVVFNA